ncbi:MAG: BlaI/MecI/CopY family transcriptional regulator [Eubacteriales bacterium]|nr:BlaI/MecI/CopY family transcriptional regulator [Clostridiales bacterium]MDY5836753.1 BlaI/MecI/CopY family transcriptional regulator [Eubacteriales bacterium]
MDFSKRELAVMEILWDGSCLDEQGEITAKELAELLREQFGWPKSSTYTYLARLREKGAISRRYPQYTLKPIISRENAKASFQTEALHNLFQGSVVNLFSAFVKEKRVNPEELAEIKAIIQELEDPE